MKYNYQTFSISLSIKCTNVHTVDTVYPIFIYIWMKHMFWRFVAFSQHWLFTKDQKLTKQQEENMLSENYIRSIAYESWLMCSAHLFRFKIITYVKVTRLWCLTNSFHQKNASQWMVFPVTASTVWGLRSVMTWS